MNFTRISVEEAVELVRDNPKTAQIVDIRDDQSFETKHIDSAVHLHNSNLPEFLDLIIDDGLHAPNANIATLIFALPKLKSDGGWFIVEDIQSAAIPIWEVVISILPSNRYTSYLIETKQGWMFACQKMQEDEAPET